MTALALLTWAIPALIGALFGAWQAGRPARSARDFAVDLAWATGFALLAVFVFHAVWLASLMSADGGIERLYSWGLYWTALTALVWVPFLVIAYVIRASRIKARERRAHG